MSKSKTKLQIDKNDLWGKFLLKIHCILTSPLNTINNPVDAIEKSLGIKVNKDIKNVENVRELYEAIDKIISEQIGCNFTVSELLFTTKAEQEFLRITLEGLDILYKKAHSLLDNGKNDISPKNLFEIGAEQPLECIGREEMRQLLTISQPGSSYTSSKFMRDKGLEVIKNIDDKYNKLAVWSNGFHWFLLIDNKKNKFIVDVSSLETEETEDPVIKKDKTHELITLDIQDSISDILGVNGICGKLCIVLYNFFNDMKVIPDNIKKSLSDIKSSPKTNFNFFKKYIMKVAKLIAEDAPIKYEVNNNTNEISGVKYEVSIVEDKFDLLEETTDKMSTIGHIDEL